MRFGLLQIVLLAAILLLLFGSSRWMASAGWWAGRQARKPFRQARWLWASITGSEEEQRTAEREFGGVCAEEFLQQHPGNVSPEQRQLVNEIGERLAAQEQQGGVEFVFQVVAARSPNAFALPGGFVFLTDSLVALCDRNASELAWVMGHEMAHILNGDTRGKFFVEEVINRFGGRLSSIGQMVKDMALAGYSRERELQADRDGVRIAVAAGFAPEAATAVLERIAALGDREEAAGYFATHPPARERMAALKG